MEHGTDVKHLKVEVYLLELKVSLYPYVNDIKYVHFSRATTIGKNKDIINYMTLLNYYCRYCYTEDKRAIWYTYN